MMKKFFNALTIASLFIAGTYAKCSNEEYGCCKDSNAEILYTDDEGNWSVENGNWCFIEPEEPEVTTSVKAPEVTSTEVAEPTEAPSNVIVSGNTFDSMFIGAWVGGPEKLPEYPQPNAKNVAAFEKLQDRHLDVINHFVIWQYHDWSWTKEYLDVAKANGSIMMMTWMPTPYTAQDIIDGKGDAYIDSYIKGIKEFGDEIWLRPLHEANGDWYTWGNGADSVNNSEDKLVEAYRHIVDKFREAKVTNVKWIWTTNCNSSGSATLTGSYPGDDYVDYTSIDGYNWGTAQSWSSWNSFEQVFGDAYNALSKFNKPIVLTEFSSSESGGDKAAWFEHMFEVLPTKFPRIVGLVVFSQSKPDNEGDWGLDSSEEAAEAWRKGISAYPQAKRRTSEDVPAPVETSSVETTPAETTPAASEPTEAPSTEVIKGDTFDSMFIGAWVGGPEKLPEYPQPNAKNVATFEKLQDRHLDVINLFVIWQYHDWSWTKEYLDVAKANGSILMMTWMPTPYTAQDIIDGKGDDYIDSYIKGIKEFGDEIWLRPLHEANGDWYTWGNGADSVNNSEDKLVEAYRHIVDKFREAKVTNVKWIWTTNCNSSGSATLTGSYPGDDYVDYTSIDGYNWGTAQSWSSWNSFEQVFGDAYNALSKFNKPIILAEFSSSESGGDKAAWFEHMFEVLPTKFPRIVGLVVFSQSKPDNEGDWGLDSSEAATEAWKKGISAYPPAKRISAGETPAETTAIETETPAETTPAETTPATTEPTEAPSTEVIKGDTFDSMFIGAWVGGPEKLPEYPQPNAKNVATFEKLQDRHLDVINLFVIWQYHDWSWTKEYLDVAKANGSILMMTWMPTPYTAQDIIDGKGDDYIDSYIKGIKEFGDEIWLRPLHEANGDWYTWGNGADRVNNSEDKLVEAYRHIVDKFREAKVTNVKWIWTTNCNSSGSATLTGSYPGDDYVDYTSIDGYNWGTAQSWSSWNSFEQVFGDAYNALSKFNKPIILAEFSSSESGGDKAAWFEHMFEVLPTKFPRIVGLVVFSQSKPDNEGDWGLDSSEEAAEAWRKGISAYPPAKRISAGETPAETTAIETETPAETTPAETTPATTEPTEAPSTEVIKGDTFDSMFIGAWVGGPEKLPEYPQPNAKNVAAFEKLQDRHLDVINHFVIWQYHDWSWTKEYLDVAKANGSIMMMTWMPTPYTAQDIIDGKGDDYIDSYIKGIKEFGDEIWLRPLHEANGDWYTWGNGADSVNNSEDKLVEAYRHIVDKFREAKVTNVKWIWTTNCNSSGSATLTGSYPGDDYVDYTSIDGYNWGTAQSWSSWNSFEQVFGDAYNALSKFNKPIILAEFSSSESGGDKAAWFEHMFEVLPTKFPRIVGLVVFSQSKPDNEGDWGLDSSEAATEAWKKGISAYPPAKRINAGETPVTPENPSECWSEKLGYKCCSAGNTRIVEVDESGKWGSENGEWCGITESDDTCWSISLGYKCCTDCYVITTDESGKWGSLDGEWCGIVEETCKN